MIAAGTAAGNSETVAHPAQTPASAPCRQSPLSRPAAHAAANAITSSDAENACPMKIVASVQIGVPRPNTAAAKRAPPSVDPRSTHKSNSDTPAIAVNNPAVNTVATYESAAMPG